MDVFGLDGVNVNEKDKEPESETDNSEDLYSDHGSDSDRPRNITSKWMAKYYIDKFMFEPNYTMRSLVHDVLQEFGTFVFTGKCGRAREAALEMIEGNHKGQYGRIYDYIQELRSTNPGLKEAIEDLFLNAEDRKCVRHMYTNFKEKHKGQALKDVVWKTTRATYLREFEDAMDQLKALSEAAYNWIKGKDPSQWSRSHFSTRSKCDMLLNNHCESFNKAIDKPILTMMETIRTKIMT
ncbi:hypothetical protein V6N13_026630 [Hibiscus sabdariffa]